MKKHANMWMGLLAVVLLLGGVGAQCAAASPPASAPVEAEYALGAAPAPEPAAKTTDSATRQGSDTDIEPMIIKTAELSIVVPATKEGLSAITGIATEAGGHIASSSTRKSQDRLLATVVIRVPVTSFEAVLEDLRALGDVQSDSVSGEDVTSDYVDLEARLKNMEAYEKELLVLMTEIREKSGKAEDVLAIYDRIVAVRGEIESIKGQMKYLADRAGMSTITVHLSPEVPDTEVVPSGWRPDQTLKDAVSALVSLLQGLVNLGIWLAVFSVCLLPFLAIAGVILLVVYILRRRARRTA